MNLNNEQNFTIRSPGRTLVLMLIVTVGSVCGAIAAIVLGVVHDGGFAAKLPIVILCGVLFLMGVFGIVAYFREKLTYRNGILTYTGIFGGSSADMRQIQWIFTLPGVRAGTTQFLFIDREYNVKMKFTDGFTTALNRNFMGMLKRNGIIPMTESEYILNVKNRNKNGK